MKWSLNPCKWEQGGHLFSIDEGKARKIRNIMDWRLCVHRSVSPLHMSHMCQRSYPRGQGRRAQWDNCMKWKKVNPCRKKKVIQSMIMSQCKSCSLRFAIEGGGSISCVKRQLIATTQWHAQLICHQFFAVSWHPINQLSTTLLLFHSFRWWSVHESPMSSSYCSGQPIVEDLASSHWLSPCSFISYVAGMRTQGTCSKKTKNSRSILFNQNRLPRTPCSRWKHPPAELHNGHSRLDRVIRIDGVKKTADHLTHDISSHKGRK